MKFENIDSPAELKDYLSKVLTRSGGRKLDDAMLYHYTSIQSIDNILSSGYIWLGSSDNMNDFFESSIIESVNAGHKLFFSSFSRAEENIAMYKMYAPSPNGAMMQISFNTAKDIIEELPEYIGDYKMLKIVRDNQITDETIRAKLYWIAVCYKFLHDDTIKAETVYNKNFNQPLNNPALAGIVKLNGWEYEREIRLCAETVNPLAKNEKIAVKLPKCIANRVSVVTSPNFDNTENRSILMSLRRKSVRVVSSEYENMVDLGDTNSNDIDKLLEKIKKLENENARLNEQIANEEAIIDKMDYTEERKNDETDYAEIKV